MSTNKLFLNIYKLCQFLSISLLLLTISLEACYESESMNERLCCILFEDIWNGYIKGVENYINEGNDINSCVFASKTPLMQAAYYNRIEILKLLIDAGANVHAERKSHGISYGTALAHAIVSKNKTRVIKLLIEAGSGKEPEFTLAVHFNNIECIKQLIQSNIDINSEQRRELIEYTVYHNRIEALRLLIEGKADLNIRDIDGHTPLTIAIQHNHVEIIKLLMLADPDFKKSKLELAIISEDMEAVKEHAASSIGYWGSCTPDKERALALALAFLSSHKETLNYLCEIWNVPMNDSFFERTLRTMLDWICFLEPTNFVEHLNDEIGLQMQYGQ